MYEVYQSIDKQYQLILTMPNFCNRPVHYQIRDIKRRICSLSDKSIVPGWTARMCRLALLCASGKG